MIVNVSGSQFTFPHQCACCGAAPDTTYNASASRSRGTRVIRTTTKWWAFPYCSRCVTHVRAWPAEWGCGAFLFGLLTLGIGWIVLVLSDASAKKRALSMCSAQCCSPRVAVAYQGWQRTVHSFWMGSRTFAIAFMRANRRKLINMDYQVLRLVDETEAHGARQPRATPPNRPVPQVAAAPPAAPSGHDDESAFVKAVTQIEAAKGPASRRALLTKALTAIRQQHVRERLFIEAARIEVRAVLDKVDGLKTTAAKRRNLEDALNGLLEDPVPDELQRHEIAMLERALRDLA